MATVSSLIYGFEKKKKKKKNKNKKRGQVQLVINCLGQVQPLHFILFRIIHRFSNNIGFLRQQRPEIFFGRTLKNCERMVKIGK